MSPPGRGGHAWRKARAVILATQTNCGICGQPVDKTIPYKNRDGQINPLTAVIDHIRPISKGGNPLDYANLQISHWRCNSTKGAGHYRPRTTSRRL